MLKVFLFQILIMLLCLPIVFAETVIGLYGVKTSTDIINAKEAGFNCVQSYDKNPEIIKLISEEAVKNEIKLIVYPDQILEKEKSKNDAKKYPIRAWYIFDEPDVHNLSREELIKLDKKVKDVYPDSKTVFLIGQGSTQVSYYDIADILMVDWYPVPHLPLESFGENVALAKQGLSFAGKEIRELWAVVQIFDWKEYEQYRKDKIGRFPKKEEIRFMSYDALFNGATGLFYFNYYSNNKPLPQEKPKDWANVVDVVQEMSFVAEIIDNGKEIDNPVEIKEPIKAKSFEYGGIKYTFIINPTSKRQNIPVSFFDPKFDVMYEKSTNLKKIARKSKNNFPAYKIFAFRYE